MLKRVCRIINPRVYDFTISGTGLLAKTSIPLNYNDIFVNPGEFPRHSETNNPGTYNSDICFFHNLDYSKKIPREKGANDKSLAALS
jgi:hypothetical protein